MPKRRFDSKKFRDRHGMAKPADLADAVGVSERTVFNWDNGSRVPSQLAMRRLKEIERERKARQVGQRDDEPGTADGPHPSDGPRRQGFLPSTR